MRSFLAFHPCLVIEYKVPGAEIPGNEACAGDRRRYCILPEKSSYDSIRIVVTEFLEKEENSVFFEVDKKFF